MITVNIIYKGINDVALEFAKEMISSGTVDLIRKEEGNLRYEYFTPLEDKDSILLIDSWTDQEAIDRHHSSPMMKNIAELREKYGLHMEVTKYVSIDNEGSDEQYIRR